MKIPILFVFLLLFLLSFDSAIAAEPFSVVINEVAWAGTTDGWRYEWIELFNGAGQAVDVSGWQIENGASSNKALVLSAGIIPSGGYFLICRKELVLSLSKKMLGCDLVETKLSLHNEYNQNGKLILKNNSGSIIDNTPNPNGKPWPGGNNKTKQTMERIKNGWQTSQQPNGTPKQANSTIDATEDNSEPLTTPGSLIEEPSDILQPLANDEVSLNTEEKNKKLPLAENTLPSIDTTANTQLPPTPTIYPLNIYINEILPSPEGPDAENEWIELYNGNNFEVNLTDWQVQDTTGLVRTYTFPADIKINPLAFMILKRTETKITLQNSGDGLKLLNPNQEIIYSIDYPKAPQGQSYSRIGETWEWSATLTPEKQNIITQPKKLSESLTLTVEKNASPVPNLKNCQSPSL